MSDNLAPAFPGIYPLADTQLVSISGVDALAFAQAQFSNDLRTLEDSQWQWNAWLTAKGRVISVFQLLRVSEQQLLAIFHDGDGATVVEQLRRFVFRRKVSLVVHEQAYASGRFAAPGQASGNRAAGSVENGLELDLGTAALPRTLRLDFSAAAPAVDAAAALAWRQADLQLGLPRLDASQREQWTPQQLGLDRLNAVSVKKGCYPGQEIVARTHFLGKAKRSLALLAATEAIACGADVQLDDSVIGTAASTAGTLALAVLPLEIPDGQLRIDGKAVQQQPLIDGLQR